MRTIAEAIAGQNAPRAPGALPLGFRLPDLQRQQCRFPLFGDGEAMRFCAEDVSADDWRPGFSGGSYCRFHRNITARDRHEAA